MPLNANPSPRGGSAEDAAIDRGLRALVDGNRRAILAAVRERPQAVGDVAADLELSQQITSHHLRVLRDAGLVEETRHGTPHLFVVRTDGLAAVRDYLDGFWPHQLGRLTAAVEGRRASDEHADDR